MKSKVKLGLDIDGVLCNFSQAIIEKAASMGLSKHFATDWTAVQTWDMSKHFMDVWTVIKTDEDFWSTIPAFENAARDVNSLSVKPTLYLTHRPIPTSVTKNWLSQNRFPEAKVISVAEPENKVLQLKLNKIGLYVDDRVSSVRYMRDNGINCLLYKAPYQCSEDCSNLPLISSLKEIEKYL